jgi:hypothetical protein
MAKGTEMTWVKLDDQFPDHPKIATAGPLAMAWHVAALCYCSRHLTDGFVPTRVARSLIDLTGCAEITDTGNAYELKAATLIERLCASGAWHKEPDGYRLHDFLEYNPARSAVLAEREQAKARRGKRRKPNNERSSGEVRANNGRSSTTPSPYPDITNQSSSTYKEQTETERVTAALELVAQRRLRDAPNVKAPAAYLKRIRETLTNEEQAEARALELVTEYPNITAAQLADALNGATSVLRHLERATPPPDHE